MIIILGSVLILKLKHTKSLSKFVTHEIFTLLGYYTMLSGSSVFMFWDKLSVPF
jgi:hypothetical protein